MFVTSKNIEKKFRKNITGVKNCLKNSEVIFKSRSH